MKKIITGFILIVLAFLSGFLLNGIINKESSVENADVDYRIAIVNNDNSVIDENGESINYGKYFSERLFDSDRTNVYFDTQIVSINKAQQGLEETYYSGYIVFPENFSESITSIDTDMPTQSSIVYKLNNTLLEDGMQLTEQTILNEIYYVDNQVNYLYVLNQFEDLSDTQDSVAELENIEFAEQSKIDQYASDIDKQFELYAENVNEESEEYNEQREDIIEGFEIDSFEPVEIDTMVSLDEDYINKENIITEMPTYESVGIDEVFLTDNEDGQENASDDIYEFAFNGENSFQNNDSNYEIIESLSLTSETDNNSYNDVSYYQQTADTMKEDINQELIDLDKLEYLINENLLLTSNSYFGGQFDVNNPQDVVITYTNINGLDPIEYSYTSKFNEYLLNIGYYNLDGSLNVNWKENVDYSLLTSYCTTNIDDGSGLTIYDNNSLRDYNCQIIDTIEIINPVVEEYIDFPRNEDNSVKVDENNQVICDEVVSIACDLTPIIDDFYITDEEKQQNRISLWENIKTNEIINTNLEDKVTFEQEKQNDYINTLNENLDNQQFVVQEKVTSNIDSVEDNINMTIDGLNEFTDGQSENLNNLFVGEDCPMCVNLNSISNTSDVTGVYNDLLGSYSESNVLLNESYDQALQPFYNQISNFKVNGRVNGSHVNLIANPVQPQIETNQNVALEVVVGEDISRNDIIILAVIFLAIVGLIAIRFIGKKNE